MSRILRALAWVAPGAAMARMRALSAIEAVRAYDGANRGRRGASFMARGTSANAEIGPALALLRNRSRDLARNTWMGERILNVTVGHAVGTGINPVPKTGSDRLDRLVMAQWAEFVRSADIEEELDLHGLVALGLRSALEGGESLLRFVPRRLGDGGVFPLGLQLMEGDHIDTSRDGLIDGSRVRLGVGLGDWNRREGYWLLPEHPGEATLAGTSLTSKFVPRSDVIHFYRPLRAGQVRGVPVFAPVLMTARDLADLMDAIVVKTRIEACFSAFVKTSSQTRTMGAAVSQEARPRIEELRPGMVSYLDPDEEVTFASPSGSGQFEQVWIATLMAMAAGAGITYDQLTGDLRQANYSSLRAGKIEFRRLTEQLQWLILVPKVMNRIWERFIGTAIMAGRLRDRREGYAVDWVMPANEPIDPRKDLEADILAVRAGRLSPQEFVAAWGRDWREVVADFKTFLEEVDRQGLVFDIDPRRVTQAGTSQPSDHPSNQE